MNNKLLCSVSSRVTLSDFEKLSRLAQQNAMSLSRYVRHVLLREARNDR